MFDYWYSLVESLRSCILPIYHSISLELLSSGDNENIFMNKRCWRWTLINFSYYMQCPIEGTTTLLV